MRIGFIGLGNMGRHMARHLLEGGHEVVVHDLRKAATQPLLERGAHWADTPKEVAQRCRLVLSSLPGPPEVEAVVLGETGILAGAQPGDVYIDLSTNSPTTMRRLAAIAKEKGVTILDAPVSGGVIGAEKATLSIMVGGDEKTFEAHRKVLELIGKNLFYLGDVGCGSIAKLMNNMLGLTSGAVAAEAMVLGTKAGIDPRKLWEVIMASTGRCRGIEGYPESVFAGNFEPGFALDLGTKDIALATTLGRELKVPLPVATAAMQRYVEGQARGLGAKSCSVIFTLLEGLAGVKVRT